MDANNDTPIILSISEVLPPDATLLRIFEQANIKNRSEWWAWMNREYGAERDGFVESKVHGYVDTAIKFPNKESYMRYFLQWM